MLGPLVNSEFYSGWLVMWGQKSQDLSTTTELIASASYMYNLGANFNFYMFHGGTNFGFWNGAEPSASVSSRMFRFFFCISAVDDSFWQDLGETHSLYLSEKKFCTVVSAMK